MADSNIPAGWYPDPAGDASKIRYWDGEKWTEQVQNSQGVDASDNYNVPIAPQPIYAQGQQNPMYAAGVPEKKDRKGFATAALILGIVSIPCLLCSIGASFTGLLALIFGILGLKSSSRGIAIAGIILGVIGIVAGILVLIFNIAWITSEFGSFENYYDSIMGY